MDGGESGVNIYADDGYEALKVGCTANGNCDGADSGVTSAPTAAPAGGAVAAVVIVLLLLSVAPAVAFVVWHKLRKPDRGSSMHANNSFKASSESVDFTYGSTTGSTTTDM